MRAFQLLPDGMGGKFNVALAEKARHFEVIRLAQGDGTLAVRTGNFLAEIDGGEQDVSPTRRAVIFEHCTGGQLVGLRPGLIFVAPEPK